MAWFSWNTLYIEDSIQDNLLPKHTRSNYPLVNSNHSIGRSNNSFLRLCPRPVVHHPLVEKKTISEPYPLGRELNSSDIPRRRQWPSEVNNEICRWRESSVKWFVDHAISQGGRGGGVEKRPAQPVSQRINRQNGNSRPLETESRRAAAARLLLHGLLASTLRKGYDLRQPVATNAKTPSLKHWTKLRERRIQFFSRRSSRWKIVILWWNVQGVKETASVREYWKI